MATDKKLPRLIINKMNQEQFETVTPSEDELYLVEDKYSTWVGTKDEYEAIEVKDNNTLYNVIGYGLFLGEEKISTIGDYHQPLLSCMWSDHLIDDMSWLRADTFSWQDGDVYKTVYDKLVEEYNGGTQYVDYGVTFRKTPSRYKISLADQEQNILNHYNEFGISWFYILDIPNKRFKLPRTKWGFKGIRDYSGNDIDESLPNITGETGGVWNYSNRGSDSTNGSFSYGTQIGAGPTGSGVTYHTISFNASRSSSTYQDNAPVQERATQMYLYFYVGEYTREAIEQTAGLNSELFNGKLDKAGDTMTGNLTINSNSPTPLTFSGRITKGSGTQTYQDIQALNNEGNRVGLLRFENDTNGSNLVGLNVMEPATGTNKGGFQIVCNTSGELYATAHAGAKRSILNWSFPSNRYKDLTLGASGTEYTAPANGYFYINKVSGSADKYLNFIRVGEPFGTEVVSRATNTQCKCFLPVKKGDVILCSYSLTGTTMTFRFYYAEGDS